MGTSSIIVLIGEKTVEQNSKYALKMNSRLIKDFFIFLYLQFESEVNLHYDEMLQHQISNGDEQNQHLGWGSRGSMGFLGFLGLSNFRHRGSLIQN